jgi:hypothetical protein
MNASTLFNPPARQRGRRLLSLIAALLVASLAFGVGLPWIVADAPPTTEELWAIQVQAPAAPRPVARTPIAESRKVSR